MFCQECKKGFEKIFDFFGISQQKTFAGYHDITMNTESQTKRIYHHDKYDFHFI